jgi:hypothetical protein
MATFSRPPKYPVPSYLTAKTSQANYNSFLNNKAANILRKDKRRGDSAL